VPSIDYSGRTALVTGASSGLGAEFARRLAARGANLILVARRKERLTQLERELTAQHGVSVTSIPLDLTADRAGQLLLDATTERSLEVHTVVNNAGFGSYGPFLQTDADLIRNEVQLNVAALVDISRAFLPQLTRFGDGALVNVASAAGFQPIPNMAIYGATKAFVLSFTEALWYETAPSGLMVLALCPGATDTEFFQVVGTEDAGVGAHQTAAEVVGLALAHLDKRNPGPSVISGWRNRAGILGVRLAPRRTVVTMAGRLMKSSE
jgi:uncharacterized protein